MSLVASLMSSSSLCVCVWARSEADSSRVGIRGQSSLYAVCWAPRQKHCWAVKQSVTKTTCSRVEDRQTQAASAAPHQELVPYHQGLRGSFSDSTATRWFNIMHFICIRKLKSRPDCCCRRWACEGGEQRNKFVLTHFNFNLTSFALHLFNFFNRFFFFFF